MVAKPTGTALEIQAVEAAVRSLGKEKPFLKEGYDALYG